MKQIEKYEYVKVWRRTVFTVPDDYNISKHYDDIVNDEIDCDYSDIEYETEELVKPEENNGRFTVEICDGNIDITNDLPSK